jgi:hypothetical protein
MLTAQIDNALLRGSQGFPVPLQNVDARFPPTSTNGNGGSQTRFSNPNNTSMSIVRCARAALSPEALAIEKATEATSPVRTTLSGQTWSQFDENDTRHLFVFQAQQRGYFKFTSTTTLSIFLADITVLQSLLTNDFPGFQGTVGPQKPLSVRMITGEAVVLVFDSRISLEDNITLQNDYTNVTVDCPEIFQFKYTAFGSNDIVLF